MILQKILLKTENSGHEAEVELNILCSLYWLSSIKLPCYKTLDLLCLLTD